MKNYLKDRLFKIVKRISSLSFMGSAAIHQHIIGQVENRQNVFLTEHYRPKQSDSFGIKPIASTNDTLTAIVLQGPIIPHDDFTLQSILLYKKNFESALVIASIWDDESPELINKIKAAGATVVLNQKPAIAGLSHINYQITSSINGILKARELGAQYVLKTRTDQRIYGLNVLDHFLNLTALYPLKNVQVQKQRLIVPNLNTFLFRLYGVTDMMMFGHIDDMILYWDAKLDDREIQHVYGLDAKAWAQRNICEVYLCTEFLKKTGKAITWELADSWAAFGENFCVVDHQSIDLYWPKYAPHTEYRNRYYTANNTHQVMTHIDWLNLYLNKYTVPPVDLSQHKEGGYFDLNQQTPAP